MATGVNRKRKPLKKTKSSKSSQIVTCSGDCKVMCISVGFTACFCHSPIHFLKKKCLKRKQNPSHTMTSSDQHCLLPIGIDGQTILACVPTCRHLMIGSEKCQLFVIDSDAVICPGKRVTVAAVTSDVTSASNWCILLAHS